ncbi:MAG: transcriptional regulator [Paludibacteraceae bacterium]|nr:transcriptional regulator [Paludibacteraceae bacterium]
MPCTLEYIEYVCSQLEPVGVVRYRKMMGDYVIYVDEKCVITASEGLCYVKMLPEIVHLMKDAETGYAYEGAKEAYILDVDHQKHACEVVSILRDVLPYPKSRSKKAKGEEKK